jgi:hypothetical protein
MPLTWDLDTGRTTTVVTVEGTPCPASIRALRSGLADRIARRPTPLLISLSARSTTEPGLFALIAALSGRSGARAVPLVVQSESIDAWQPRVPLSRALRAARDTLLDGSSQARTHDEQLLPVAGAARRGRDVATEACARWGLPELVGPAAMVASELTSYATRHAGTLMNLTLAATPDTMYVAVQHGHPAPTPPDIPADLELHLINAVAGCWGFLPHGQDTITWAALAEGTPSLPPPRRARQPIHR